MDFFAQVTLKKEGLWHNLDKKFIESNEPYIFSRLTDIVDIEENLNLQDVMDFVYRSKPLSTFIEMYSCKGFPLDDFYAEMLKPCQEKEEKIDSLVIEKNKYHEEVPYCHFCGTISQDPVTYCVSLTPLNEIKHLPIRIVNNEYRDTITLLEFLHTIFYEISFYGSPDDRNLFLDKLNGRIKNINKEDCIPLEQFKEKIQELKNSLKGNKDAS